jgi:hypothetical protein
MISFCRRFPGVKDIKETEMSKGKRRNHSAEFKARIALEAWAGSAEVFEAVVGKPAVPVGWG